MRFTSSTEDLAKGVTHGRKSGRNQGTGQTGRAGGIGPRPLAVRVGFPEPPKGGTFRSPDLARWELEKNTLGHFKINGIVRSAGNQQLRPARIHPQLRVACGRVACAGCCSITLDRQMLATMKASMVGDILSIANKADWGARARCLKWTYARC